MANSVLWAYDIWIFLFVSICTDNSYHIVYLYRTMLLTAFAI